jgi:hypothetical protein
LAVIGLGVVAAVWTTAGYGEARISQNSPVWRALEVAQEFSLDTLSVRLITPLLVNLKLAAEVSG